MKEDKPNKQESITTGIALGAAVGSARGSADVENKPEDDLE